jgi:hypothetical protein
MNGEYKTICWRRKQPLEGYAEGISLQNASHSMVNRFVWTKKFSLNPPLLQSSKGSKDEVRHQHQQLLNLAKYFQQQGQNGSTGKQQLC